MKSCDKWAFCPLGDLADHVGCRKPHCPKGGMSSSPQVLKKDIVIQLRKK